MCDISGPDHVCYITCYIFQDQITCVIFLVAMDEYDSTYYAEVTRIIYLSISEGKYGGQVFGNDNLVT